METHDTCMASKHVQTELPEDLHAALQRAADERGQPLKALVREAIEAYLAPDTDDPLLAFVGRGELPEDDRSERKDWRTQGQRRG